MVANVMGLGRGRRGLGLGVGLIEGKLLNQGVRPRLHAAGDVAGAELGDHLFLQNHAGEGVGKYGLKPIAHLDAHLVFRRRDDEDRPVIETLLADAPMAQELIAIVGDLIALQAWQGDHDELAAGLLLQGRQLCGQVGLNLRRQHMGVIHHPAAALGELWRGGGRRLGEGGRGPEERGEQAQKARQTPHGVAGAGAAGGGEPGAAPGGGAESKLTVGADWADSLAVKSGRGCSLL